MCRAEPDEDKALREQIMAVQTRMGQGYVSFPYNAICSFCGHDFLEDPSSLTELKSGCPGCHRSYC